MKLFYFNALEIYNKILNFNINNIDRVDIIMRIVRLDINIGNYKDVTYLLKNYTINYDNKESIEQKKLIDNHFSSFNDVEFDNIWLKLSYFYKLIDNAEYFEAAKSYNSFLENFHEKDNGLCISKIVNFLRKRGCYEEVMNIYFNTYYN